MIEIKDPSLGTLTWQPPEEFVKLVPGRMDPAKIQMWLRGYISTLLLSQTVQGELAEKADRMMKIGTHTMSIALNELADIAEGTKPYPLTDVRDYCPFG